MVGMAGGTRSSVEQDKGGDEVDRAVLKGAA
jgi:hypothetical protein